MACVGMGSSETHGVKAVLSESRGTDLNIRPFIKPNHGHGDRHLYYHRVRSKGTDRPSPGVLG